MIVRRDQKLTIGSCEAAVIQIGDCDSNWTVVLSEHGQFLVLDEFVDAPSEGDAKAVAEYLLRRRNPTLPEGSLGLWEPLLAPYRP